MAGEWIKFRKSLVRDGRVRIVSRNCHAKTVTVIGALVTLWTLADDYADEDGVLLGYTAEDLDAEVDVPGFAEALPAEWLDTTGEFLKLPDYQQHNGTTAKARAQAADRKRRERSRNAATSVAKPSRGNRDKTATREEKNKNREELKPPYIAPATIGEGNPPEDQPTEPEVFDPSSSPLNLFTGGQIIPSKQFLRYMKTHVKKSHYRRAAKAWNEVVSDGADPEQIISAYATSPRVVNASSAEMVPNPEAYLLDRCFEDPPVTPATDEDRTGGFRITDDDEERESDG